MDIMIYQNPWRLVLVNQTPQTIQGKGWNFLMIGYFQTWLFMAVHTSSLINSSALSILTYKKKKKSFCLFAKREIYVTYILYQ